VSCQLLQVMLQVLLLLVLLQQRRRAKRHRLQGLLQALC
jgi:hypothetical protein